MFTQILVPLDGSKLAESALPAAVYLSKTLPATIALVHVIEKNAPVEIHGDTHLRNPGEAELYLKEIAARYFSAETKIDVHVHTAAVEDVAKSIVDHVGEFDSDLIVMCAHGSGGIKSLIFGFIAQQVIASGKTPVLLIQPICGEEPKPFTCGRILVPLDGQPEHELGLKKAMTLAKACDASLNLALVVHTIDTLPGKWAPSSRLLPGSTSEMLDMEVQNAGDYLRSLLEELQRDGFTAAAEVFRGDPAEMIIESAERLRADLIVLGTHAKTPMSAFWSGSVAPKICKRSKMPLLLVPVL
jgi:nucleotide-binding universal stress UspA family protein